MPLCTYNSISYNGYVFDGFIKSNLNREAVKSEDQIITKYIRNTLEVEFIITHETVKITNDARTYDGVDLDMDYIRSCLESPNKSLHLSYHGAGQEKLVSNKKNTIVINHVESALMQFGMGPFPEILQWEPLANNRAVRCRWRCVFFTERANIPILNYIGNLDKNSNAGYHNSDYEQDMLEAETPSELDFKFLILSVVEEQEVDINEEGYLTLTLKGTIELSLTSVLTEEVEYQGWDGNDLEPSNVSIEKHTQAQSGSIGGSPNLKRGICQMIARLFDPYLAWGFKRKQRYNFHKNNRFIEYVITDTEIPNSRAQFPKIVDWNGRHRISSQLATSDNVFEPQGFLTWESTFDASFTVAPGYWKGWAWVAFFVLVKQRIERTVQLASGSDTIKAKDEIDAAKTFTEQDATKKANKTTKARHLLTRLSVDEALHNNEVSLSASYLVITSLDKLFANTGLFTRMHTMFANNNFAYPADFGKTPKGNPSTWTPVSRRVHSEWLRYFLKKSENPIGYTGLGLADYNLLFDPSGLNYPGITTPVDFDPTNFDTEFHTQNSVSGYIARRNYRHFREWGTPDTNYAENERLEDAPTNPQQEEESFGQTTKADTVSYNGYTEGQSTYVRDIDPKLSWVDYNIEFELIEVSNSSYLPTIQARSSDKLKTTELASSSRAVTGLRINGAATAEGASSGQPKSNPEHKAFAHGKPTYYVKCTGYAIRTGYQIPQPVIAGLHNVSNPTTLLSMYKVGTQRWKHTQLAQTADVPVYYAEWDLTYAVDGDPTNENIGFRYPNASEFA